MSVSSENLAKEAESLFLQGRIDDAAALCAQALRDRTDDPEALKILGMVTLIRGDHAGALQLLEKVSGRFQNDFRVQLGLAESKWGLQRIPEAADHLRRAVALEPQKSALRVRLAFALLAGQRFEEARAEMEALLKAEPNNAEAQTNLGVALINLRQSAAAIDLLRRATAAMPEDHNAPFHMGQALRDVGQIDDAIDALREAVRRNPNLAHLRIALGDALWGRGHRAEGRDELQRATELDPKNMLAWTKFGDTEQQGNNLVSATNCYRKAMALFTGPFEASPFRMLGNVLFMSGQTDEAEQVMKQGLQSAFWFRNEPKSRDPNHPRIATLSALGRSNTPTDYIIDPAFHAESICILKDFDYPAANIDRCFDVVFNSASDPDTAPKAIEAACRLAEKLKTPVINPPSAMVATMRHHTPEKLGGIDGLYVPPTRRFERKALLESADQSLAGMNFPVLLRPAGSHGGTGLVRIESMESLLATAAAIPDEAVYITEYYDFASSDGLYRKLRMVFVDGQPFPFHLSISDHWLNHYYRTKTSQEEMLRTEEEKFLVDPEDYLGSAAYRALGAVATRHKLGFFGLDGALDRDGRLIVFECNATMLVRHRDRPSEQDHKRAPAEAIRDAMTGLLKRVARPA